MLNIPSVFEFNESPFEDFVVLDVGDNILDNNTRFLRFITLIEAINT